MKSSLCKMTLALMALLLCLSAPAPALLAEETLSMQLHAQTTLEGTLPNPAETYTIRMTAEDAGNPMPNGQKGGTCDLILTGAERKAFSEMRFDRLGVYTYTIEQVSGSYPDCRYDAGSYRLTVSIVNSEQGSGFDMEVALRRNGETEKTDTALFHNVYKTIVPTPAPTTPPGKITATGVNDGWMYSVGGAIVLLAVAAGIVRILRRGGESGHEGQ